MSGRHSLIAQHVRDVLRGESLSERKKRLEQPPEPGAPVPHFTATAKVTPARAEKLWGQLPAAGEIKPHLLDPHTMAEMESYQGNIENCLGAVRVPVGVAGPLRVRGLYADGCYLIPL